MDPLALRLVQRFLAFTTNPKAVKPQFKKLDEALKHLEHPKGSLTEGPNFHAYSQAIDAFRQVVYFLEHSGKPEDMASIQPKYPHLAIMSKNPFDPEKAVSEAHGGKLFEQALAESKHLETAYEHAHKEASAKGIDTLALRVAAKFHTRKELQEYLKEHPDADKSQHKIMTPAEKTRDYEEHKKDAAADKPTPELISEAMKAGEAAFKAGKRMVPALDPGMHKILSENRGDAMGWSLPLLHAWSKGWHKANLSAP